MLRKKKNVFSQQKQYFFIIQVSAVHISIIVLTVLACTSRTNTQAVYSGFISLVAGILFVLKMVYQIRYIDQSNYDVNCNETDSGNRTDTNNTVVVNNPNNNTANWIGFYKLVDNDTLMDLLSGYIVYIVALTGYNLILMHQQRKRFLNGKSVARPKVLFVRVTRNDADKDLTHLVKYLFNFAFYKFGVEITLFMMVLLISSRMDIVSVVYAVWLWVIFSSSRDGKRRIWPMFQWFIVVLIIVQYVVVVNFPPFSCFSK